MGEVIGFDLWLQVRATAADMLGLVQRPAAGTVVLQRDGLLRWLESPTDRFACSPVRVGVRWQLDVHSQRAGAGWRARWQLGRSAKLAG